MLPHSTPRSGASDGYTHLDHITRHAPNLDAVIGPCNEVLPRDGDVRPSRLGPNRRQGGACIKGGRLGGNVVRSIEMKYL